MKHSDDITKLAAALVAAQAEMKGVEKDALNPAFKSKFVSLDGLITHFRPVLARHKLAVTQGASVPHTDEHGKLTAFTGETMLIHESGQWLQSSIVMPVGKSDPQGVGSALTYFRRYGLAALLCISSDEDDDANSATPKASRARPQNIAGREAAARAVADSADNEPITKDSLITFGTLAGTPIRELKDSYLRWALEDGRHFGPRTEQWQAAFRAELASRDGAKV
jgi:hypothetical protein